MTAHVSRHGLVECHRSAPGRFVYTVRLRADLPPSCAVARLDECRRDVLSARDALRTWEAFFTVAPGVAWGEMSVAERPCSVGSRLETDGSVHYSESLLAWADFDVLPDPQENPRGFREAMDAPEPPASSRRAQELVGRLKAFLDERGWPTKAPGV